MAKNHARMYICRCRELLLDDVCRIVGPREWLDEFWRVDEEGKVALLLGKGVGGVVYLTFYMYAHIWLCYVCG